MCQNLDMRECRKSRSQLVAFSQNATVRGVYPAISCLGRHSESVVMIQRPAVEEQIIQTVVNPMSLWVIEINTVSCSTSVVCQLYTLWSIQ